MEYFKAFITGGLICVIGQLLIDKTKLTPARILTTFVVAGAFLQLIGIYQPLHDFAGAGASVPRTGFGATLCRGVIKTIQGEGMIGILKGSISAASAGISVALVSGLVVALFFSSKQRN